MLSSSRLRRNAFSGAAAAAVNSVVALSAYPVFLHGLGAEQYGWWLLISTGMQLALLGDLGISRALTRFVAEAVGRDDPEEAQQHVNAAVAALTVGAALCVVTPAVLADRIDSALGVRGPRAVDLALMLPGLGVLTAYALLCQVYHATLAGLGRMDLANYQQALGRATTLLVSATAVSCGLGLIGMMIGFGAGCLTTHAAHSVSLRRVSCISVFAGGAPRMSAVRRIVKFGGSLFTASVFGQLVQPFNKLLLTAFCGVASVPVYEVAYSCTLHLRALGEAAIKAVMPEVSRMLAAGAAQSEIRALDRRVLHALVVLISPCYLAAWLSSQSLLSVWLGPGVAEKVAPLVVLLLPVGLIELTCVPSYYTLIGLGHARAIGVTHAVYLAVNTLCVACVIVAGVGVTPFALAVCLSVAICVKTICLIACKRQALTWLTRREDACAEGVAVDDESHEPPRLETVLAKPRRAG